MGVGDATATGTVNRADFGASTLAMSFGALKEALLSGDMNEIVKALRQPLGDRESVSAVGNASEGGNKAAFLTALTPALEQLGTAGFSATQVTELKEAAAKTFAAPPPPPPAAETAPARVDVEPLERREARAAAAASEQLQMARVGNIPAAAADLPAACVADFAARKTAMASAGRSPEALKATADSALALAREQGLPTEGAERMQERAALLADLKSKGEALGTEPSPEAVQAYRAAAAKYDAVAKRQNDFVAGTGKLGTSVTIAPNTVTRFNTLENANKAIREALDAIRGKTNERYGSLEHLEALGRLRLSKASTPEERTAAESTVEHAAAIRAQLTEGEKLLENPPTPQSVAAYKALEARRAAAIANAKETGGYVAEIPEDVRADLLAKAPPAPAAGSPGPADAAPAPVAAAAAPPPDAPAPAAPAPAAAAPAPAAAPALPPLKPGRSVDIGEKGTVWGVLENNRHANGRRITVEELRRVPGNEAIFKRNEQGRVVFPTDKLVLPEGAVESQRGPARLGLQGASPSAERAARGRGAAAAPAPALPPEELSAAAIEAAVRPGAPRVGINEAAIRDVMNKAADPAAVVRAYDRKHGATGAFEREVLGQATPILQAEIRGACARKSPGVEVFSKPTDEIARLISGDLGQRSSTLGAARPAPAAPAAPAAPPAAASAASPGIKLPPYQPTPLQTITGRAHTTDAPPVTVRGPARTTDKTTTILMGSPAQTAEAAEILAMVRSNRATMDPLKAAMKAQGDFEKTRTSGEFNRATFRMTDAEKAELSRLTQLKQ